MTNEPIDALLKTGGTPGGEAEEDDDDQNLMEEEASAHDLYIIGSFCVSVCNVFVYLWFQVGFP